MIVDPFTAGAYTYADVQTMTARQARAVAALLRNGLIAVPSSCQCELIGVDPSGEYPQIRLGAFVDGVAADAWWLGCNALQPGSTDENIVIKSRLWPGRVGDFNTGTMIDFSTYLLGNRLGRDDGGTVQITELLYSYRTEDLGDRYDSFLEMQTEIETNPGDLIIGLETVDGCKKVSITL